MELKEFINLVQVVKKLRDPNGGCPWDLKQNHQSLVRFLIEESYEFAHAAEKNSLTQMEEEIGDVLLQVLLHSIIAEQEGSFSLDSVSKKLADKMIRRHPHVFANPEGREFSEEEIKANWQSIKSSEKNDEVKHLLKDEIHTFPALLTSYKIGIKSKEVNFDWDDPMQVAYKVEEEWQELKEELAPSRPNIKKVEEELGDFLFSAAQLARHLGLNPEDVLRKANQKFTNRYNKMAHLIHSDGKDMKEMTQESIDHYWVETKKREL